MLEDLKTKIAKNDIQAQEEQSTGSLRPINTKKGLGELVENFKIPRERKVYGAKPTVVTDESQIPTVVIDEGLRAKLRATSYVPATVRPWDDDTRRMRAIEDGESAHLKLELMIFNSEGWSDLQISSFVDEVVSFVNMRGKSVRASVAREHYF